MEKMTPPPNYYGAPYPQNQMQNNAPYPSSPQFGTPFSKEAMPVQNMNMTENSQSTNPNTDTYDALSDSIENVEHLFEVMKNKISSNIGRNVKVYASFTDSTKWHDMVFEGKLVAIADDFMIVKSSNDQYDLISRIYVNFISFFDK